MIGNELGEGEGVKPNNSVRPQTGKAVRTVWDQLHRGAVAAAVFDFDGTISLLRGGWRTIMVDLFEEEALQTARVANRDGLREEIEQFVDRLTGQPTLRQCEAQANMVAQRGGQAKSATEYLHAYADHLRAVTARRMADVDAGRTTVDACLVPHSVAWLRQLKERKIRLFLVSGTDEPSVVREAEWLGVSTFFEGIYGAPVDGTPWSKLAVIRGLLAAHAWTGADLIGFGDGWTETRAVVELGGVALGVALSEDNVPHWDDGKAAILAEAGAAGIVAHYGPLLDPHHGMES